MWNIITGNKNKIQEMNTFFNKVVNIDGFFKPINENEYQSYLENIPGFSYDGVFLAYDSEELVGMGIGVFKNDTTGQINCILVDPKYRNKGVGEEILAALENYFKINNHMNVVVYGYLPSCYSWYIPKTTKHDHPCAPGVSVNSDLYFFLIHHGYEATGFQDAFHLNLSDYEISPKIAEILERNKKDGITIELYDETKHHGIDEFCKELNIWDFEKVIKENLSLEKPYPFLVIVKEGQVVGWTGALWNEPSGRGHFDGIAILPSVRGRGLGKALFSMLAYQSKLNGASFMTFYTGLTNHARYIYMGAGFKIIQSFALMKKVLK